MDESEKTFRTFFYVAGVFFAICVGSCTAEGMHKTSAKVEMVAHGANPLDADCSVEPSASNAQLCAIRALAKQDAR